VTTTTNVLVAALFVSSLATAQVTVEPGDSAPDFTLVDAKGNDVQLSSFRGKSAVVLEFFRSGDW